MDDMTGSRIIAALEEAWYEIRDHHLKLPDVFVVTGSGFSTNSPRWGHFRCDAWRASGDSDEEEALRRSELFVAGETLAVGPEKTMETLLHEAAHTLAWIEGVGDTSRQGRWHNRKFLDYAQTVGLQHRDGTSHPQYGWCDVILPQETREKYEVVIRDLRIAIQAHLELPDGADGSGERVRRVKRESSETKSGNVKVTCQCEPPRIMRASRSTLSRGPVTCSACGERFDEPDEGQS